MTEPSILGERKTTPGALMEAKSEREKHENECALRVVSLSHSPFLSGQQVSVSRLRRAYNKWAEGEL